MPVEKLKKRYNQYPEDDIDDFVPSKKGETRSKYSLENANAILNEENKRYYELIGRLEQLLRNISGDSGKDESEEKDMMPNGSIHILVSNLDIYRELNNNAFAILNNIESYI